MTYLEHAQGQVKQSQELMRQAQHCAEYVLNAHLTHAQKNGLVQYILSLVDECDIHLVRAESYIHSAKGDNEGTDDSPDKEGLPF